MAEYILKNEKLKLTVAGHGAEIRSLVRNSDGREMMWQADPAYWVPFRQTKRTGTGGWKTGAFGCIV